MVKKEGETGTLRIVSLEGDLELDKAHKCHLFYGPKTIRLFLLTPWNYSFKHQEPVSFILHLHFVLLGSNQRNIDLSGSRAPPSGQVW